MIIVDGARGWRRWMEAWTNRGSSTVGRELRRHMEEHRKQGWEEGVSISGWSRTRKGAAARGDGS